MPRTPIFVGLSGGVDSAVAAALLQRSGQLTVGVFLEGWSWDFGPAACPQAEDRREAARVAAHLGIPFLVLPCAEQYRQRVLAVFLRELVNGRTPNPDALCNVEIKFQLFLETALAAGARGIATGHYARLQTRPNQTPILARGRDPAKDQSYFLGRVAPEALAAVQFPVGELRKVAVRQLARRFGLPNANRPDSQGLCFVGPVDLPVFLQQFFTPRPGPIVTTAGQLIGEHPGLAQYTIGQRHGLRLGHPRPFYIVEKRLATNALVVSDDPQHLERRQVPVVDWISRPGFQAHHRLTAKLRYRQPDQAIARWSVSGSTTSLEFAQPQRAVTPGQLVAVYDGEHLVAAGTIA